MPTENLDAMKVAMVLVRVLQVNAFNVITCYFFSDVMIRAPSHRGKGYSTDGGAVVIPCGWTILISEKIYSSGRKR